MLKAILDMLSETRNHFIDTLARMQTNGHPIVLCGAGYVSQITWDFMQRQGMSVDYVAISEAWLKPGDEFNGKRIVSLESLTAQESQYNYIIAMQFIDEPLRVELERNAGVILFYDPTFVGINAGEHFTTAWCETHQDKLNEFYANLTDEASKTTLIAYLNQRISARAIYYQSVFHPEHYFPHELIRFGAEEIFIDGGAYNGDSIAAFVNALEQQNVAPAAKIFAFEPDKTTFALLEQNTANLPQCVCINAGIWNTNTTLRFNAGQALSSAITDAPDADEISLKSIDNVVAGEKVTFIKMDIEGSELEALKGAQATIEKHYPILAISLYHKPVDLITIPQFIHQIQPGYHFYLRAHHPRLACELVLYAIPPHRLPTH
ncbi:FkbM family methyltransferase [Enterobacter roggenkampii]|nr:MULTISPECIES: FkbM family methyltransferase [Enterobacter]EKS7398340.1 FkbM family methyltransferase [Enterobacter roggenkampii]EKU9173671.1 FkbM family methyltransferase [Enterobacter roggenkampii MGH 34]EKU9556668.1 FkbM family methyltransferase [Enterobacter roggenkampii MGH 34]EKW7742550.1 FkbM family methyltransferase [Enterobacter roggenkampii]EKY3989842.1 FkbM family methyltransferase [Enterobacter roggenkampii]